MATPDPTSLAQEKASELLARPQQDAWAACAAVWAQLFILAGPGWSRWPHLRQTAGQGLLAAIQMAAGTGEHVPDIALIARLESFDVEDDGSTEWQYAIDLYSLLIDALKGADRSVCTTNTLITYLDGTFNIAANKLAVAAGRPISQSEADHQVPEDNTWRRAVRFVNAL